MADSRRGCGNVSGRDGGTAGMDEASRDGPDAAGAMGASLGRAAEADSASAGKARAPADAAGARPAGAADSLGADSPGAVQQARIRIASPHDAGAIAGIYRPYVEETAITFEWTAPEPGEMAERIAKVLAGHPYLAAEDPGTGEVLGYAYASPYYGRAAYCYCCEASVYLRRGLARQGLGTRLYGALEGALRLQGLLSVCACIAVADGPDPYLPFASVPFHEARGFRRIGRYPQCGFKFGRWYGVVWMEKPLGPRPKDPPAILPFPAARGRVEALLSAMQPPPVRVASAGRQPVLRRQSVLHR